jgi:hypothetical protein
MKKNRLIKNKSNTFASSKSHGTMAEWLGNGLQNRVQRFDSAWYLFETENLE